MTTKKALSAFVLVGAILLAGVALPASAARTLPRIASPLYRLSPEIQISTPSTPIDAHRHQPAVAYNWPHEEYLVVWHNEWPGNRDIYGQRVSKTGERLGPWFAVSAGTGDRVSPALAYSATDDEYLVVWMKEVSPDVYEIWGRIIAWNNAYQRSEFKIISWTDRSFWTPRVAWNSYRNEYMVVWNAFLTTESFPPGLPRDIAGSRVTNADGGKVIDTDSLTTGDYPHQVDIAYNLALDQYFVAFVVVHPASVSGNDIYGLRVNWDGAPVGGLISIYEDAVAGGRRHQNHPAVATNQQDKYMVVWDHEYDYNDHDIYAREYNANGTPVGSYFTVSSWTEDDTVPRIAANGGADAWVTVWQRALPAGAGHSIHGFRWGSTGSNANMYVFDVINWTFHEATDPVIAAGPPGYLIAYEELPPPGVMAPEVPTSNYQHIYGRVWWAEALYVPLVLKPG